MFNLSGHNNGMTGESELKKSDIIKKPEKNQSIINCLKVLTGMSHEMRTHMNAIVAFSFLMNNNGYNDEEREDFSNQILNSCEQLIGLFDNFLDSVIIDTGNSKADIKICKLDNVLDELFTEFRETLSKDKYKDLVLVTENQLANITELSIDSNRVIRVIRNLFQNALSNTKSGYIKVRYFLKGESVIFYVQDSGQGFHKSREFLLSQNLNESLSKYMDVNSAVNITLARKIIGLLGGEVRIERNGATGTGICFSVPAKSAVNTDISVNKLSNTTITI